LYKFNFVFPNYNQFIFSGDFVRPITIESAIKHYIYPFVLNEHGIVVDPTTVIKIPYWSLVLLVSHITSLNIAYWLLIVITQVLSGLLISTSARILFSPNEKTAYYLIPLIPSIFAIFSYPINYRPYWLFLPFLPGLLQCLFLILIGYLAVLQIHIVMFILITLISVLFITILLETKRWKIIKNGLAITKNGLAITFWFSLPFLVSIIPIMMLSNGQPPSPSYIYTYTVLKFMSTKANFINALVFSVGFWEKVVYTTLDKLITLLIVAFILILYSFITKKKPFLLSIFLIFVISISFQLGINNPLYKLLANPNSPLAWILRDPFKVSLISLGLFTTIFTFTLRHLSVRIVPKNRKILTTSFILTLVILSLAVWSPTTKTSEIIRPSTIPEEYFTAINYLNEKTEGPLLFLPIAGKGYTWADNPYLEGSVLAKSYQGSYIDYTITSGREAKELINYATSTENLKVLSLVTSGIVIDTSIKGTNSCYDKMALHIISNYSKKLVKLGDYLYFLPNEGYSCFKIVREPLYLIASTDYTYIGSLDEFLTTSQDVIFFDKLKWALIDTGGITLFSNVANPSMAWSLGYTYDPLHGAWHYYLEKIGIENWQSDYGKGLVFTWAASKLKENPTPDKNDLINQWIFNSLTDLNQWKNYTSENQFGALHSITLENNTLKTELWNATWGWKNINSPLTPAEYGDWYRWQLQRPQSTHKDY